MTRPLAEQTMLVTGATQGIGNETARALARFGARLFVTARDEARGARVVEELKAESRNPNIELALVDFASFASVRAFLADVNSRTDRRTDHGDEAAGLLSDAAARAAPHAAGVRDLSMSADSGTPTRSWAQTVAPSFICRARRSPLPSTNAARRRRPPSQMQRMERGIVLTATLLTACAPAPAPPPDVARMFPTVEALPDRPELPELFASFFSDRRVETSDDFTTWRRDELNDVLTHYAYGLAPARAVRGVDVVAEAAGIDGIAVDYVELAIDVGDTTVHLAVFSPAGQRDVPAVLGPNRCGNQTVVDDERVRASDVLDDECSGGRGGAASSWPVARITAAGFALATFHQSELAIDDFQRSSAPALAAWAAGSSFAIDALERTATPVDPTRVAVFGHSRRGKAALLAGARDERIAAVVAHQSGTLGSSILRNGLGESLLLITGVFPHWFTPELSTFVGLEDRLPFDQHHLLALMAPRPLLLVDGEEDDWADPQGSLDAARAADAAWQLLGDDGLVEEDDVPRTDATLVWRVRPGDHDVATSDWELFLPFLERHLH